jgi:hypothetical protein
MQLPITSNQEACIKLKSSKNSTECRSWSLFHPIWMDQERLEAALRRTRNLRLAWKKAAAPSTGSGPGTGAGADGALKLLTVTTDGPNWLVKVST